MGSYRINRYIMECKFKCSLESVYSIFRINRYIMECKYEDLRKHIRKIHELIDTLWNVNVYLTSFVVSSFCELIDTLWNVNFSGSVFNANVLGINRYIMECKYTSYYSYSSEPD